MPRTTTQQYLSSRRWLIELWAEVGRWADISPDDQRLLHLYFAPSEPLSDDQALEHRRDATAQSPSLPQRAGRALSRFRQVTAGELKWMPQVHVFPQRSKQRARVISVREVLQPQPDAAKFARALLNLTPEQLAKLRAGRSARDD